MTDNCNGYRCVAPLIVFEGRQYLNSALSISAQGEIGIEPFTEELPHTFAFSGILLVLIDKALDDKMLGAIPLRSPLQPLSDYADEVLRSLSSDDPDNCATGLISVYNFDTEVNKVFETQLNS